WEYADRILRRSRESCGLAQTACPAPLACSPCGEDDDEPYAGWGETAGTPAELAAATATRAVPWGGSSIVSGRAIVWHATIAIAKHSPVSDGQTIRQQRGDAPRWKIGAEGRRGDGNLSLRGPTFGVAGADRIHGGDSRKRKQVERNAI